MLIDVFTDRYEPAGTAEKKTAHVKGLWHRTFSCLVTDPSRRTVLLQKKSPGRYVFDRPDYADITVGGHYEAGETIEQGVRELHEELGLTTITYGDLHPIGVRQTAVTLAPDYLEREFQHWHLLGYDDGLESIPLADAEVAGLVEIGIDDALDLATSKRTTIPATYLTRTGVGESHKVHDGTLDRGHLIPGYLAVDQLYVHLFAAARRYAEGDRDHLYW